MGKQRFREQDPVVEILNIALQNQGGADVTLRQRLLASASELGLSEDAVLAAEQQWLEQQKQSKEAEEYRSHILRALYMHIGVYVVINIGLFLLNMVTDHGQIGWALYPLIGWGIALGTHVVAAMVQLKNPGGEEYDAWKKGTPPSSPQMTIGVRIPHPPRHDETLDRS